MGNGRHSGLPKGLRRDDYYVIGEYTVTVSSNDSKQYAEWKQKLIQDALQDYDALQDEYSNEFLVNNGLNTTRLQRAVLRFGLGGPGRIAPNADFDKSVSAAALDGVVLHRGSTTEAIDNLVSGELPYIGDGVHGNGIYFSTRLDTARQYANWANGTYVTAFIDKNLARPVTEDRLYAMLDKEPPAVRERYYGDDYLSGYALYKGYNVIHVPGGNSGPNYSVSARGKTRGEDYYVPLTREILVFREHAKK